MSHVVSLQTQVRDSAAVSAACERLRLPAPIPGAHRLFAGEVNGLGVQLPGWTYPVVCQTETGQLLYDNFEGAWGELGRLHEFMQSYAVEKTRIEARRFGRQVQETALPDGSIKLTILLQGGVA